ncbi:MAG: ATP-binding protein [Hyphomicrobiales bacterium]
MPTLAKLLRTSPFRFTALSLVLFAVSSGAVLAYVYWNTAVLLERQTDETIAAEVQGLNEQYRQGGLDLLIRTIGERSKRNDSSLYLFTNYFDRRLAGNMDGKPKAATGTAGWFEFPYSVRTEKGLKHHRARGYHITLRGGFTLVVGRDIEERLQFANLIKQALYWALGLTAALGIVGGLLVSRNFLRRVDTISQASRNIMAGDLTERMPVAGTGDELDHLSASLNGMLDQIERLMTGMKEVTDNVAHDLKTPLTRLKARVEDALREDSKEAYRTALELTIEEADNLLRTFGSLLSIARTEAGEARAGFKSLDLASVVAELGELYEPLAEDAGGRLTVAAEPELRLNGDRQLLAQSVANLLDNALKYAGPEGGMPNGTPLEVGLTARRDGGQVVVDVTDNGPGIPEPDRGRVVERFVRLDASRSKPGSGLGLSLVSGVAKLHGGRFELLGGEPGLLARLSLPAAAGH